jgi:MFS superfamily sulfate permease-like transporter
MTDIDFTGLSVLAQIAADLERDGVDLRLARASEQLTHSLRRARTSRSGPSTSTTRSISRSRPHRATDRVLGQ